MAATKKLVIMLISIISIGSSTLCHPLMSFADQNNLLSFGKLVVAATNSPVVITTNIINYGGKQTFVAVLEIADSDGITHFLAIENGTVQPNGKSLWATGWTPDSLGSFTVTTFLISNFTQLQILSTPVSSNILVIDRAQPKPVDISQDIAISPSSNASAIITSPPAASKGGLNATAFTTKSPPTLDNLRQYALTKINQDREKSGLGDVKLSSDQAAQAHAQDILKTGQISHWMSNGEKPYMTYTRYGGLGAVFQNIAMTGDNQTFQDCSSGLYNCDKIDPYKEINSQEYELMYNDEKCCQNGHRDNILDKYHTDVSIGIAYNDYEFVMVQNFENNYVTFNKPITKDNKTIEFSGMLSTGTVANIFIYYDVLPTPLVYEQNKNRTSYDPGTLVAGVAPYPYEYTDSRIQTISSYTWNTASAGNIDIVFDMSSLLDKKGVYTIYLTLSNPQDNNDQYDVTSYSIIN